MLSCSLAGCRIFFKESAGERGEGLVSPLLHLEDTPSPPPLGNAYRMSGKEILQLTWKDCQHSPSFIEKVLASSKRNKAAVLLSVPSSDLALARLEELVFQPIVVRVLME